MGTVWEIIAGNTVVAVLLALAAIAIGRLWKNAAAMHLLWIAVLLKLFTPPLLMTQPPRGLTALYSAARLDSQQAVTRSPARPDAAAKMSQRASGSESTNREDKLSELEWSQASQAPIDWFMPLSTLLMAIWIGGAASVAAVYALRIGRFATLLRTFDRPSPAIHAVVAEISRRLGLRRVPDVLMTSRILPPLVWSIGLRPRIILPTALFARLNGDAQAAILAHELVHIRRRDYLVRLLELVATTVFWWHPLVHWASRQLRELEEECCDARVLGLFPQAPRTYAVALVDTWEFLSERPRTPVPLPTAIHSAGSLSRRIHMLRHDRANRLTLVSAALLALIVSVPLVVGFAADPGGQKKSSEKDQQSARGRVAVLQGHVTDEAGAFLPDTRIRVAVPATDMRFADSQTPGVVETKTDGTGEYRLEIPGITQPTKVSLDAMHLGYRRLVGTLMNGGDAKTVVVSPGATSEASLVLRGPTLYFAGTVVDEQGRPISGVQISANARSPRASGGIERTSSRSDGTFELFNYTPERFQVRLAPAKGIVWFFHPDYVEQKINDLYTIADKDRETLRVVLPSGRQLNGVVLDTAGKPVLHALVKADGGDHRKTTLTDAKGRFTLRGLPDGRITLSVRALDIKQKTQLIITMDHDIADLAVRLKAISLPANLKKVTVLGMQLTDVTPQLQSAYDLWNWNKSGALILDPGKASDRFEIGKLAEGYNFWMVGEKEVGSVREFVKQLVDEASHQPGPTYSIRVVYSFHSLEFDGTNTQYIKLTQDDLKQLRTVLEQLAAAGASKREG